MATMVGVCYVSQREEISTRAPRFCVSHQAPHAVAGDGTHAVAGDGTPAVAAEAPHAVAAEAPHAVTADGTHAVAGDGSHAVTVDRCARAHAPWPPPVELNAEGQALRERLRAFHTQAVRNTTRVPPPATP